jgi:hypothetical protein
LGRFVAADVAGFIIIIVGAVVVLLVVGVVVVIAAEVGKGREEVVGLEAVRVVVVGGRGAVDEEERIEGKALEAAAAVGVEEIIELELVAFIVVVGL